MMRKKDCCQKTEVLILKQVYREKRLKATTG
jgi:hypothetical protein